MPAKKGSIDKNLVRKILDESKEFAKKVWYSKAEEKALYIVGLTILSLFYVQNGVKTHSWTPRELIKDMKKDEIKKEIGIEYQKEIEKAYNLLFKDSKTFEDSVKVYNSNPILRNKIRLRPIYSLEEMEKVVKQSKLEDTLK